MFTQHDGVERAGNDLRELVEQARGQRRSLQPLARKVGNLEVVEQAAIAGAARSPICSPTRRGADAAAPHRARASTAGAAEAERGWQGEVDAERRADLSPHPSRRRPSAG